MSAGVDIGTLITTSPEMRGGRPCVAGTGMTVMRIAGWYKLGCSAEEIARKTGLSLAQIHGALAYYHSDPEPIDADLEAESVYYDTLSGEQHLTQDEDQEDR